MVTHVQVPLAHRFLDQDSEASGIEGDFEDDDNNHNNDSEDIELQTDLEVDTDIDFGNDDEGEDDDEETDDEEDEDESSSGHDNETSQHTNSRRYLSGSRADRLSVEYNSSDDEEVVFDPTLGANVEFQLNNTTQQLASLCGTKFLITSVILILSVAFLLNALTQNSTSLDQSLGTPGRDFKINFEKIDEINEKYPKLLTPKSIRMIKTRLAVMRDEVSILLLVGKARDNRCNFDPTFCVGRTIANATEYQFNYLDASDDRLDSGRISKELSASFDHNMGQAVMIDSLEELPGNEVMNLFQFIDKDDRSKRRGMLLFVIYTGLEMQPPPQRMKESELVEKILVNRWSPFIPKDSLTSVISRISGSVVKLF